MIQNHQVGNLVALVPSSSYTLHLDVSTACRIFFLRQLTGVVTTVVDKA